MCKRLMSTSLNSHLNATLTSLKKYAVTRSLILQLMHSSQEDCQLSNPASTGADDDEEDEEDKENSDAFPECRRTFLCGDHLRPLTVALELWETCFADSETTKRSCKEILDSAKTVQFLQITSVIFKLMQVSACLVGVDLLERKQLND